MRGGLDLDLDMDMGGIEYGSLGFECWHWAPLNEIERAKEWAASAIDCAALHLDSPDSDIQDSP